MISRDQLLSRLEESSALVLVSAPAGYGKTSLVADWSRKSQTPVAWLSLSSDDSEPHRFLSYVIAALQTVQPAFGEDLLGIAASPEPPDAGDIVEQLISSVAEVGEEIVLVLDDLHTIEHEEIDRSIRSLVDNLPTCLRLVILTREDPALPLASLRAQGRLTEIRLHELSFTRGEAQEFANDLMDLGLDEGDIATLHDRTEGWVAGLQMAGIALRDRDDPQEFLRAFAGSHRFIVDYLVEEVLGKQTKAVREFLLATSILERLSAPLCEAVTGVRGAQEILAQLEVANMMIVPMDDQREWYRYHQLFADVLRARAAAESGDMVAKGHARASRWFESEGDRVAAVSHAFLSQDIELYADVVERTWPELFYGVRPMTWLEWAERIPGPVVAARPVLSAACAWMLLDKGDVEEATRHLAIGAKHLGAAPAPDGDDEMVVANTAEFQTLEGSTEAARAYAALLSGDTATAIECAVRARTILDESDHFWQGTAALFVGLAHWWSGDLEAAHRSISHSVFHQSHAGNHFYEAFGMANLAEIRVLQGRPDAALRQYKRVVALGRNDDLAEKRPPRRVSQLVQDPVALYAGMAELNRQWGLLDRAKEQVERGMEIRSRAVLPATAYRLSTARARILESQDVFFEALAELEDAERLLRPGAVPDPWPLDSLRARIWSRSGQLDKAIAWAKTTEPRISPQPEGIPYSREFEFVTRARIGILAARAESKTATVARYADILTQITRAARATDREAAALEASILLALAREAEGKPDDAFETLRRAIEVGKSQRLVQVFIDEIGEIEQLLLGVAAGGGFVGFVKSILKSKTPGKGQADRRPLQLLVEPISAREQEVLGLIDRGRTNQEIADELFIALSTVKKHLNNLFGKLAVRNRTEAIRKARDLDLL